MPKHNFMCFLARHKGKNTWKKGTNIVRAFCNEMSKATCLDSVVTIQYGHERETCLVFLSESSWRRRQWQTMCTYPVLGTERHWLPQKRDGSAKRRFYGQVRQSFEQLVRSIHGNRRARVWNDLEKHIEFERVQRPDPRWIKIPHLGAYFDTSGAQGAESEVRHGGNGGGRLEEVRPATYGKWLVWLGASHDWRSERTWAKELWMKLSRKLSKRINWEPTCWQDDERTNWLPQFTRYGKPRALTKRLIHGRYGQERQILQKSVTS